MTFALLNQSNFNSAAHHLKRYIVNMKFLHCLIALTLLGQLFALAPVSAATPIENLAEDIDNPRTVEAILTQMSLDQKIGQLLVIGVGGVTYDVGMREMIEKYHIGGVMLFGRNIESPAQVARLVNDLQTGAVKSSGAGLLVAIDEEGGTVARLTKAKGFTEFPSAMAISASAKEASIAADNARRVAEAMSREMKAIGLNANFAPNLDTIDSRSSAVVGVRSFSSDPERVAALGKSFILGLQRGGVLAFGKHFPGHGGASSDSHLQLPVVTRSREQLTTFDLVPFKAAITVPVAGLMTAHVSFPEIDATPRLPGSLSTRMVTELLRSSLQFQGLISTDSLDMAAVVACGFSAPEAAARALSAGSDLILLNNGYHLHRAAIRHLASRIQEGVIPIGQLDEAVRRILSAKKKYGLLRPSMVDPESAAKLCGSREHHELSKEISSSSVTLIQDNAANLPLGPRAMPVVVAVPSAAKFADIIRGVRANISYRPTDNQINEALRVIHANPDQKVILLLSDDASSAEQKKLLHAILATDASTIVVALSQPYGLASFLDPINGRLPTLIATYGASPETLTALARIIRGYAKPVGRLPVELSASLPVGAGMTDFVKK
jgi:beta-N-acetylhexosaminidase